MGASRVGIAFPWVVLSRLHLDKFYSDLIESIIGPIFVDSRGDFSACEAFLVRIGFVSYLKPALADGVDVQHPKTILGHLAGAKPVSYKDVVLERLDDTTEKRYSCVVTVGEQPLHTLLYRCRACVVPQPSHVIHIICRCSPN